MIRSFCHRRPFRAVYYAMPPSRITALCAAAIIAALYVVGLVSGTLLRHVVQTAPLWLAVVLGWRRSVAARWIALPIFLFWLAIVVLIWLFLLHWARVVSGHFSPAEIAMTIVMGIASTLGLTQAVRERSSLSAMTAAALVLAGVILQAAAFRISLLPGIANR